MIETKVDGQQGLWTATEASIQLSVPDHIAYSIERGAVTLFDLRRDRYFGLPPALEIAFGELAMSDFRITMHTAETEKLSRLGLVVDGPGMEREPIPEVVESWFDSRDGEPAGLQDALRVTWVLWRTRRLQRRTSLYATVERLRTRRPSGERPNLLRMKMEALSFRRSRSWSPLKPVCLLDSLALLELLHAHSLYPMLVFGVIRRPFAAHCWLQTGNIVINDHLDHVREYTPILAV